MPPFANPYRWDLVDPTLFSGRAGLATYLVERLLAGDRFAIAGGRRMGKTTLLRKLELELATVGVSGGLAVLPIFVDASELHGMSAADVYRLLIRRVEQAARRAELPSGALEATSGPELAEALTSLLHATRRLGRLQLVFLFDEIERVMASTWGSGFLAHWRMLLNNLGELSRCVSAAFCGAGGLYQLAQDAGSPLGNILAWQELELFDGSETARLMREPSGYPWPDSMIARVHDLTGGHPCLIQYLMQRICGRDPEQWSETLAEAEQSFLREHARIFTSWWQSFDEPARAIYAHLARGGPVPEGEIIARFSPDGKRSLEILAHTGVVRWDRTARTAQAAGTLFGAWTRDNDLLRAYDDRLATIEREVSGSPITRSRPVATVLFTDIVGSTALTAELGDRRWLDVVDAHNTRVRGALATFQGREIKTMGDGFLAIFDTPTAAIECACSIVRAVRPLGFEVRAGLHAGEYQVVGDDVLGIAISYASWVMSRAQGGEVIVSETVRGLVAGSGIRFVDRGAHRVKGSRERHRLFAVDHAASAEALSGP